MKIYASCLGDPSVGIHPAQVHFDFPDDVLEEGDEDQREILRESFRVFVGELMDEAACVWFSDECPDCAHRKVERVCVNKNCMSYGLDLTYQQTEHKLSKEE